jgi:hypothetical protein
VVPAIEEDPAEELGLVLDQELARLPDRYRAPILLCELGTNSRPEAARLLGIPEGTLSSRLARAKALLRARLARRGIGLTVAALAAGLGREAQATALKLPLAEITVKAATGIVAGGSLSELVSLSVFSLTEKVIKAMLFSKLKGIVLGLLALSAVAVGAAVLAQDFQSTGNSGTTPVAAQLPPTLHATRSESDRLQAVEQKLDRILEALGSSRGTSRAFAYSFNPKPENLPQDTTASTSVGVATAAPAAVPLSPTPAAAVPVLANLAGDVVPRRLADLEARLGALERRIADLERRANAIAPVPVQPETRQKY